MPDSSSSTRPRARRSLRGARIAALGLLALLVLAELGANLWILRFASLRDFGRYASLRQIVARQERTPLVAFSRHPYLGYYPTPHFQARGNLHNSLGFRGAEFPIEKPAGELRIVCIGGSTTYGLGVDEPRATYPALLEEELHRRGHRAVRVINAGCNGWCTCESLINLHLRVLDLEPDLLLVYHSVNDIHARLVWPPERYLGDNSGFRSATSGLSMPSLIEHSALYRILAVSKGRMLPHAAIERSLSQAPPWSRSSPFRNQVANGNYPSGFFAEVPAERILAENPPIYYRRNLTEMARTARLRGIGCVLTSFSYLTDDPRSLSATPEYQHAYAEHEEVQRAVAAAEGARYFDFAALFPREGRYFVDDMHMNEEGNRLRATIYADYLEREGLLGAPR